MKARRGSTWSPISVEKTWSAAAASSTSTRIEHPVRRVHRRVGELLGVHLAETLEAADLDALLRELERVLAKLAERLGMSCSSCRTRSRTAGARRSRRGGRTSCARSRRSATRAASAGTTTLDAAPVSRSTTCTCVPSSDRLEHRELVSVRLDARRARPRRRRRSSASTSRWSTTKLAAGGPKSSRSRETQPSNSCRTRMKPAVARLGQLLRLAGAVGDVHVLDPLARRAAPRTATPSRRSAAGFRSSRGRAAATAM